jgi:hypothetical protein
VAEVVCESCGESNVLGAEFCSSCQAYLGWEGRPDADRTQILDPRVAAAVITRVPTRTAPTADPAATSLIPQQRAVDQGSAEYLDVALDRAAIEVATGAPSTIGVTVCNRSDVVEGYVVDVPSRPAWLQVDPAGLRLLPGATDSVALSFTVAAEGLVPAQQIRIPVRVRAESDSRIEQIMQVAVTVPIVDGVLAARLEPQTVRVRDLAVGATTVLVECRGSNRPVRVALSAKDPELAVDARFFPAVLDIAPGASASARIELRAALPATGTEVARAFTVTAREAERSVDVAGSFVQAATAAVVDPPVQLRLEPTVVRVRDATSAEFVLQVDHRRGRQPARIQLVATDPERIMGFDLQQSAMAVPAGAVVAVRIRVGAPTPEPGVEVTRPFTVTAISPDPQVADASVTGTFVQLSTPPIVDPPVGLRLDPEVVQDSGFGGGRTTLTIDNRAGRLARRVSVSGYDPERAVRLTFQPAHLEVPPGGWVQVGVRVSSPRPEAGAEDRRPFTVTVNDGATVVESSGTVVHGAGDPRPVLRIGLVVLGAALMVLGAFLPWLRGAPLTGVQWTFDQFVLATTIDDGLVLRAPNGAEFFTSIGFLVTLLAALVLLGLTGPKGRLIRLAALLCALAAAGFVVAFVMLRDGGLSAMPDLGLFAVGAGAVLAFAGSLIGRR